MEGAQKWFVCDGHHGRRGTGTGMGQVRGSRRAEGPAGHSGSLEAASSPACLVGALIPH